MVTRFIALLSLTASGFGQEFQLSLDQVVAPDQPGPGAGIIRISTEIDTYQFTGTNGQIVFLEEISVAQAFQGWLSWDLKSPSGTSLMSSYFEGRHEGRRVLPENGVYTLRVRLLANNPAYTGPYSFRVRSVPPDDTVDIQIGDTIEDGSPATGAGRLESPGARDMYRFEATAGQAAWFEELSADSAFEGWLVWELRAPSDQLVFRTYIGGGHQGRQVFPESGVYTLSVLSGLNETNHVGAYSVRLRAVPPDQHFPINIGDSVTNGVPGPGAGHIEAPGAWDVYTFSGTTGQSVYFDALAAAQSLRGYLHWETRTPSGQSLFSSYLSPSSSVGRKTLPETGTYTMRLSVQANDPTLTGIYSFRLRGIDDSSMALTLGSTVSPGAPGGGAGRIEDAGGQDLYSFNGFAGQELVLEQISAAQAFNGWLRWELLDDANQRLAIEYFKGDQTNRIQLPATGAYQLKIYVGANNATYIGDYSFRLYSPVFALPDRFAVKPAATLVIPKVILLCNDRGTGPETLTLALTNDVSDNGGTLVDAGENLAYTAPVGFSGTDTFTYQIAGQMGGLHTASVWISVTPDAEDFASIVSAMASGTRLDLCLFGVAGQKYEIEASDNFEQWTAAGEITADARGIMNYSLQADSTSPQKFYRFAR